MAVVPNGGQISALLLAGIRRSPACLVNPVVEISRCHREVMDNWTELFLLWLNSSRPSIGSLPTVDGETILPTRHLEILTAYYTTYSACCDVLRNPWIWGNIACHRLNVCLFIVSRVLVWIVVRLVLNSYLIIRAPQRRKY